MKPGKSLRHFIAVTLVALFGVTSSRAGLLADTLSSSTSTTPVDVIVGLKPGASLTATLGLLDGVLVDSIAGTNVYLVSVPSLPNAPVPGTEYLEPNRAVSLPAELQAGVLASGSETPADWYAAQPSLDIVHDGRAHAYSTGTDVVVADIDARFDSSHPALAGHLTGGHDFVADRPPDAGGLDQSSASFMFQAYQPWLDQSSASFLFGSGQGFLDQSSASFMFQQAGVSFVPDSVVQLLNPPGVGYSHGTFTAGLIAVTAPQALIMPLRAFDDQGRSDIFTLAKAIHYAVRQGADVINMSWGLAADSTTLHNAIRFAADHGVTLVAAAGNSNNDTPYYPAAWPEVIAVAATNEADRKASFSTYGPQIYVDAPGVDIISAYPGDRYSVASGTSFSAPIVAGEAALIKAMTTSGVTDRVGRSAVNIDAENPHYAGELGLGRIDMLKGVTD